MTTETRPILYNFRRCPYAMRARLAIAVSGIETELREVVLKDKPEQLIAVSPKATVPVLVTADGKVINESLDIMQWALSQHDPLLWFGDLDEKEREQCRELIARNDGKFKHYLDRYKYADRYPEHGQEYYRQQAERFLQDLEQRLLQHGCLVREQWTWADMALLPFIRQFCFVDWHWFEQAPYPALWQWLDDFLQSPLFARIMLKYAQWHPGDEAVVFP
jgi:glutathione S-transferase